MHCRRSSGHEGILADLRANYELQLRKREALNSTFNKMLE